VLLGSEQGIWFSWNFLLINESVAQGNELVMREVHALGWLVTVPTNCVENTV
jgi:hypothetical protein